jgi:hypothetical protein
VTIVDTLNQIWTEILNATSLFVMPDWSSLIQMLPILIFIGVVGPFLTFTALGSLIYVARKPRVKVAFEEGPRVALLDDGGQAVFPAGFPHCRRDSLVYPSGTTRCEVCHDPLTVTCPMCGLGRLAIVDTCTNCGLVLQVKPKAVAVRSSPGAKPGGAAAA